MDLNIYIIQFIIIGFLCLLITSCDTQNNKNVAIFEISEISSEEINSTMTSISAAPDNELMPLIIVEGKRYWKGKKVSLPVIEQYITEDNYLGTVNKTVDCTTLPTQELSANFPFAIGGKLYRIDDNLIILYAETYSDYNQSPSYYYCDLYE